MQLNATSRLAVISLIGCALILAAVAWRRQQEREGVGKRHAAVGKANLPQELPPLTAKKMLREADLKGKVVLINFWGWWCEPCQIEFPHLMELEQSLRSNPDFRFVSIACSGNRGEEDDPELHDRTAAFLSERRTDIPTYIDPWQAELRHIASLTGKESFGLPLSVVIDRDGAIRGLWPGYHRGDELEMRAVIDEALK
jgi:cytochrome c biogenesis protein CcmG, thiol:disulfide interchange protein DsbE